MGGPGEARPEESSGPGWQWQRAQRHCVPWGGQCARGEGAVEVTFAHPAQPTTLCQVGAPMTLMSRW